MTVFKRQALVATLIAILSGLIAQTPFPITNYDFHNPDKPVSAVTTGMGGLNNTYLGDPGLMHNNPALLAFLQASRASIGLKMDAEQDVTFSDMLNTSNLLEKNQINYGTIFSKNAGFSWTPLVSQFVDYNPEVNGTLYHEYQDYRLDAFNIGFGGDNSEDNKKKTNRFAMGANIRYITGRLVHLKEHYEDNKLIRDEFIDSRANGFSSDLGIAWDLGSYRFGLTLHDIWSRLYWSGYSAKSFEQRGSLGWQWAGESMVILASWQRRLDSDEDQTFHCGLEQKVSVGGTAKDPSVLQIRVGCYSTDLDREETTWVTVGCGYNYRGFLIDGGMRTNKGEFEATKYNFNVSLGF